MIGPLRPLPHQVTALAALASAHAAADRAQLVSACGTGKTLTARWHAQAAGARLTVVFVPSLALVAQTLGEWRRAADPGWAHEALVVCSDPSTAAGAAERAAEEGGAVDRAFWSRVSASVTTSPAVAQGILAAAGGPRGHRLAVFCTYHSAPVLAAAARAAGVTFDLAVCDEAHRLAGRPSPAFRTVLDDGQLPARKRLFMTATPVVDDGDEALSMDDETVFGPRAHTVTFADAITAGQLTDWQVLVIADERVSDGRAPARRGGDADPMRIPGAVLSAASAHHLRSMLSFHTYVDDAVSFAALLDGVPLRNGRRIQGSHLSSRDRGDRRVQALRWLGEDTGGHLMRLVASARCLTEGVDVPGVDSVLFADPRKSVVSIIQAVGRALRSAPGKQVATIIIPVTVPDTEMGDDAELAAGQFGHVWMVLRALRAHDERFAAEIDGAAEDAREGRRGHHRVHGRLRRVRFILPPGFALDEDQLRMRMVDALDGDAAWDRFYGLLTGYAVATDGALLPFNKTWEGHGLGAWAFRQIAARKAGVLPGHRAAKLEQVPGWAWDRDEGYFADNVRRIADLAAGRPGGLAQPPGGPSVYHGAKDSRRRPLGPIIAGYRQRYRDGMLPGDQAARLEQVTGWDWTAGLPADDVAMVQALRLFCEFAHHPDVPAGHVEDGLPLGAWVAAVRRRKLTGRLHPALAEEIIAACPPKERGGTTFAWQHARTQWMLAYTALVHFHRREGHARVPAFHVETLPDAKIQLGQWCGLQRFKERAGDLDPEYTATLDRIPGWEWNPAGRAGGFEDPVDVGGDEWHGRPKAIAAGCKCERCLPARRATDREHLRRKEERRLLELGGAMTAGPARRHLERLQAAARDVIGGGRNGRGLLADLTGVPLGVIRQVLNADTDVIGRRHDAMIRAVTPEMVLAAPVSTGSRGRAVTPGGQRIPAAPTRALLADLKGRGFGTSWVCRELGYATTQFIGPDSSQVTRRVADQVADLHARCEGLTAPPHAPTARVPSLAELRRHQAPESRTA